jgi:cation diffusion facilitator family transporter
VILGSGHLRHHRHDHDATCGHAGGNDRGRKPAREAPTPDHNLRAAYLHVLADALTSVSAVVALTFGKFFGQTWLDPVMGIVGSALIARWSYGLLRDTGHILIDAHVRENLLPLIRSTIESVDDNRIADLHVWKVGPDSYAAIVCVVTDYPRPPDYYRGLLANIDGLSHVSVEVQRCCQAPWFPHAPGPESRKGSK